MDIETIISQIDYQTYWGVFFFGIIIATTAMSTGVDGAAFWGPVLLLVYGLDASVAVACAIFIELFGFGSGILGYAIRKKIMYKKALKLLIFAIPFGILGSFLAKIVHPAILIFILSFGCLFLVYSNIQRGRDRSQEERCPNDKLIKIGLGRFLTSLGGMFGGAIGIGLGETNNYYLGTKNKYPYAYAAGTTVFMIGILDLFCSIFNAIYFNKYSNIADFGQIISILVFAVPAVIIGAQLGVFLAHWFKKHHFSYFVAVVLFIVSSLSFYRAFLMIFGN